jgi:hypothetical protein
VPVIEPGTSGFYIWTTEPISWFWNKISICVLKGGYSKYCQLNTLHKKNSLASVRKRTIPTERPPLVSEASVNFFAARGVPRGQRDKTLRPYSRLSTPERSLTCCSHSVMKPLLKSVYVKKVSLKKTSSVAWVRARTIPTERPPLVREVSANFWAMPRGQWVGTLRPYSRRSRPEPLLFLPSSSSVVLTRLSGHRSRPTTFFFLVVRGNRTRGLRICSKELWPLDHRVGSYIIFNWSSLTIFTVTSVTQATECWTLVWKF